MSQKKRNINIDKGPLVLLLLIGDTFHLLRLEKEVAIRQVAKAIKMAPHIISKIEKGDKRKYGI